MNDHRTNTVDGAAAFEEMYGEREDIDYDREHEPEVSEEDEEG